MPTGGRNSLGARWQLDAALLSRPVDLTSLVSLSQTNPTAFFEDDSLQRMVKILLNATDETKADKDTRLDVLTILSNLARRTSSEQREHVKMALDGVNEWFDEYLAKEESSEEPEMHKLMLLLLSRLYDYKLRCEDLLELVRQDKILGLETVVGLLEDGETYSTELFQKQAPTMGKLGQWEHKLVCRRHEKPLVLQLCRLLRGFTLPASYFFDGVTDVAVEAFTNEMNLLLDITLKTRLVEKIALACHECLFASSLATKEPPCPSNQSDDEDDDQRTRGGDEEDPRPAVPPPPEEFSDSEHRSIACIHSFLQNLYFYASNRTEEYRQHLLADTLLVPRLVLPYLDRSVEMAKELNARAEAYEKASDLATSEGQVEPGRRFGGVLEEHPALVQGISASLRTLIVASFRAPPTRFMLELLRRLNPTESLLRASTFVARHEYVFALLCLLNVNMGAFDLPKEDDWRPREAPSPTDDEEDPETHSPQTPPRKAAQILLEALANVHRQMTTDAQGRVLQIVTSAGALPVSRDTRSFAVVMSVLLGGSARGQYGHRMDDCDPDTEAEFHRNARAEAKQEAKDRADSFEKKDDSFRLLGDLPSLTRRKSGDDGSLRQLLDDATDGTLRKKRFQLALPNKNGKVIPLGGGGDDPAKRDDFPTEFACAINGHLIKDPLRYVVLFRRFTRVCRSPYGHVFEKSTILLWLETRGSVCPITGKILTKDELHDDPRLRSRLIQWNIGRLQSTIQSSVSAMHGDEDDLYDF